jgi:hypothetical protein
VQPVAIPIVEGLLAAPVSIGRFERLSLLDQGLGLAPLHPAGQIVFARTGNFLLRVRNPRAEHPLKPVRGTRLLKPCQAISELPASYAGMHQLPTAAIALNIGNPRVLQPVKIAHRGRKSQAVLLLFQLSNAQQPAHCA